MALVTPTVGVWDRFIRLFHWSLVASFATAYFSTEHIDWVHKGAGYGALFLVLARVVWGFFAHNPHARFANFVPTPSRLMSYLMALFRGREPRHLGHNPAGAVMILFLMLAVLGIAITGWMLTTDMFWGSEWVEQWHTGLVDVTLWAIALHVVANVYESVKHRENMVWSMVTGRKRVQTVQDSIDNDVDA